ncbi:hypothetical protein F3J12_34095 [Burkholderia sp. Ax-1735]|nr:hypothetical protein [Burkholderia sp. Ap-955]NIF14446.1 hypothetical protein [Burkholderia sp. Ax-1735]NIG07621.1 hypothetical protein [Burkholderia sp. Tr-849]
MQDFENVERARTDAQRRALTANVALLEIHRQRSDLDHGRLRVPQDDRPVNAAVHPAGCPAPAHGGAGRTILNSGLSVDGGAKKILKENALWAPA